MIIIGTEYFPSFWKAVNYYSRQLSANYSCDVVTEVRAKIANGEIVIGKPVIKPGEKLIIIDNGTRYAIESEI